MPAALESAGYRVERHSSHFTHAADDPDILREVGRHSDWIFLTHDSRQRYVPEELHAIMTSGVAHIIHIGRLRHDDLAKSFVLAAPKILRFREKHQVPFIAKLYRPETKTNYRVVAGPLKMELTFADWQSQRAARA